MKGKKFRNKYRETKIVCASGKRTSSALLIPKDMIHLFKKLTMNRSKTELLTYLLKRYKMMILFGQLKSSKKIKTLYQKKNQNLQRVGFKPKNEDWIELGIIASALGCSRTLVFTTFLELEFYGIGEFFELPMIQKEVSYLEKNRANVVWRLWKDRKGFSRILWYLRV